ncbi:MAG: protein kinase [Anaerolineae bacterium]|jgi:predicted Ser/Thr protein kinase|nr:protein kinase [Anaerolineae bacterium]
MDLKAGDILQDRYQITSILGQGGMGAVYRAKDMSLNTEVAIKVNFRHSEDSSTQFMREAQLLAKMRHPNLPRVIQYFLHQGNEYLVMDFIPGDDLKQIVKNHGAQPIDKVLDWAAQLGDALTYLHRQDPPIFHRDIKPENIKITPDGEAILVDFGIAKAAYSHQQTQLGARGYTPGYAPPEQYGGGRTGSYTDQYGLAATLYYLLTGNKPLDSVQRVVEKQQLQTVVSYNRTIPLYVSNAIDRGMALNPADRFDSVDTFIKVLTGKAGVNFASTVRQSTGNEDHTMTALGNVNLPPATIPAEFRQTAQYTSPNVVPPANAISTAPTPMAPAKKKFPFGIVIGGAVGLGILAVIVVLGYLYLSGNLFPTPTIDMAMAVNQTMTHNAIQTQANAPTATEAPIDEPAGSENDPTPLPTDTPEPTITNTPESTLTPTPVLTWIGQLAYVSDEGGDGVQLWLMKVYMDMQGNLVSEKEQLTSDPGDKSYPAWSPDGKYIVYSALGATPNEGLNLYRISLDDPSNPSQITSTNGNDIEAAYSSDGSTIAYDNDINVNGRQIRFVNSDGSNDRRISFDFIEYAPIWHPQDKDVYFFVYLGAGGHRPLYWRYTFDEQSDVNYFDSSSFEGRLGEVNHPAFSPNAEYIAYTQENYSGSRYNIALTRYNSRGSEVTLLTNSNTDSHPSISWDSNWIAFMTQRDGNYEIYIMDMIGEQETNLSNNSGVDMHPAWFPIQ